MRWFVLLVLLIAALAGCTDEGPPTEDPPTDDGEGQVDPPAGDTDDADDTTDPEPEEPTRRDAVTWEVEVRDNSFSPASLTIQKGDTVKWVRVGTNPHTVTAENGDYHSGSCPGTDCFAPATRQSFEHTFETLGGSKYLCEVHPSNMKGTITVKETYHDTP